MEMSKSALYNCKTDGDGYRITKFTPDLDVESSYLVSGESCECPAGHRHTCRHRLMLPKFISKHAISGEFFLDFDRGEWLRAITEPSTLEDLRESVNLVDEDEVEIIDPNAIMGSGLPHMAGVYAKDVSPGIRMLDLAQPSTVHTTIAEAVGEGCDLEVTPTPSPSPTKPFRRI